jgi:hypothetical protein
MAIWHFFCVLVAEFSTADMEGVDERYGRTEQRDGVSLNIAAQVRQGRDKTVTKSEIPERVLTELSTPPVTKTCRCRFYKSAGFHFGVRGF